MSSLHGTRIAWALVATTCLCGATCDGTSSEQDTIPAWTLALEQRLQPWCPAGCVKALPFTAVYKRRGHLLVFVAVRHVFSSDNNTIRAVDSGFALASPAIIIVEGFPTAMGENPQPLIEQARKVGTANADEFTRGEAMHAASLALARGIPFLGGEPTRAQQVQALRRKGYVPADIAFDYLLGGLSQSIRSGDVTDTKDPKLDEAFGYWARAFADQYRLEPMSFEDFAVRYRSMIGVELTDDAELVAHSDLEAPSALASLHQADMITRDEHLLATIEKELASKRRVLVVYGASHWTTLSEALEKRMGEPKITVFPE